MIRVRANGFGTDPLARPENRAGESVPQWTRRAPGPFSRENLRGAGFRPIFPAMQTAVVALLLVMLVGLGALIFGRSRTVTAMAGGAPPAETAATGSIEHVDAPAAARLLERSDVTVLDLRTPEEFAVAHLAGARLVNYNSPDFARELARLDRSRTYLIHCASGRRSTAALKTFRELGFQRVIHLDGGLRAWQGAGLPVVKGAHESGK